MTACKSNLKNIGTAMEMYSTDWAGKYPSNMSLLTPNYLKTLPSCPAAEKVTYKAQYGKNAAYNGPPQSTEKYEDYYFVECAGENHKSVSVGVGYPQYNGVVGLIER